MPRKKIVKKTTNTKKKITKPKTRKSRAVKNSKTSKSKKKIRAVAKPKANSTSSKKQKKIDKEMIPRNKQKFVSLRGMKDLLPRDSKNWQKIYHTAENLAVAYGFGYIETPIIEPASLFIRSIGKGTDVVSKEMYVFEDKDGSKVCLRPEMTASIARAYINHGMQTVPQPVKVWYWGPMFRHDRPQAGRYRQFHQFGCETLGEKNPVVDAELITIAYNTLRDLGIETTVRINSIGTVGDRENYIIELVGYLRSKRSYLSDESKRRINRNPLRILDSKAEADQAVIEEAPQIIDWLSGESKKFFMDVLEYLDELDIPYVLTPTLVRGLDYYTDTVFELFEDGIEETSQSALGGGGRYDGLVEHLEGQPTPASGFSLGVERILLSLQRKEKKSEEVKTEAKDLDQKNKIFFAQLGEQARKRTLHLIEELRRSGLKVYHNVAKLALKSQLELANKLGVTHTLILGQKEVQDGTVLLRNMESGIQEIIDQRKLHNIVEKLLKE